MPDRRPRIDPQARERPSATRPPVNCPQCGEPVAWSEENRFRPFCSQRCRTLDLGAWASESYRVPEPPAPVAGEDD